MQDEDSKGGIQAIARAGRVLRALEAAPEGLSLAELSAAVALPKSTVHRLVAALGSEELIVSGPGGIRLGGGLARLGAVARQSLKHDVQPVLLELRATLDETVDLAVLDGAGARFVDQVAAEHRLRAVSSVGARFPLHCTANGKALLAALPVEVARGMLPARMERFTDTTITSREELLKALADGPVHYDREEHTEGICAVGAAVYDDSGVAAAISVPVPTARFTRNERALAKAVAAAAADATARLGGSA